MELFCLRSRKERVKENEQALRDFADILKCNNICIMGVQKKRKEQMYSKK